MSRINKCKGDPVEDALIVSRFLLSFSLWNILTRFVYFIMASCYLVFSVRYDMLTSVVLHENDAKAADITSPLRVPGPSHDVRGAGLHPDLVLLGHRQLALHPLPLHPDPPDRLIR